MIEAQNNFAKERIEEIKTEREKLFFNSLPIFFHFDNESRDFFLKIATLSSAIGAFSFLLYANIANPKFLVYGDILLIITIIVCLINYFWLFSKERNTFRSVYDSNFERMTNHLNQARNFLNNQITKEEYLLFIQSELSNIGKIKGNKNHISGEHIIVIMILSVSLIFISLSFFS